MVFKVMGLNAITYSLRVDRGEKLPEDGALEVLEHVDIKKRRKTAIKKNEIMPFAATWMDPETVTLSEVSQTEKDKYRYHVSLIYMESKKAVPMNLFTKQK